jgi:BASS family bile acid:Na+ symporter
MGNWISIDGILSWVLVLIMFAIGATLRMSDFRRIFWRPTSLVLGLLLQMLFLPLFTFCVVSMTDLDPLFKVGFIIVSLCPGGTTSNFVSYLINADVALSIALTTINSFLILLTIPIGTNLALSHFLGSESSFHLPFGDTLSSVFLIILLPAFIGLIFNHFFPRLSLSLRHPLKIINAILLGGVYAIKFFSSKEHGGADLGLEDIKALLPVALLIQVVAMVISYVLASRMISRKTSCVTLGIEVGLQNTALALVISSVFLANVTMSKPALVYAMFSFFTTLAFAWLIYRFVILENRRKYK